MPGWNPPLPDMLPMWLPRNAGSAKTEPVTGWVDRDALQKYLMGQRLSKTDLLALEAVAVREDRTGIGIDPDRLTADQDRGLIYSASFWRLAPGVCFYGEVESADDAQSSPTPEELFPLLLTLPWGGEGRRVRIERTSPCDWSKLQPPQVGEQLLNLLLTPGIFHSRDRQKRPLWKPRENGTLLSAVAPKPQPVSGWDMAGVAENNRQPRPRPTRFTVGRPA